MKKDKDSKFILRQFKDKSSNWFLNNKHYHLNEQGVIVFISGGKEDEKEIKYLEEPYVPHRLVGVMAQNTISASTEKKVWSVGNQKV